MSADAEPAAGNGVAGETYTLATLPPLEKKLLVALLNLGLTVHRGAPNPIVQQCRRAVHQLAYDIGPIKTQRVMALVLSLYKEETAP